MSPVNSNDPQLPWPARWRSLALEQLIYFDSGVSMCWARKSNVPIQLLVLFTLEAPQIDAASSPVKSWVEMPKRQLNSRVSHWTPPPTPDLYSPAARSPTLTRRNHGEATSVLKKLHLLPKGCTKKLTCGLSTKFHHKETSGRTTGSPTLTLFSDSNKSSGNKVWACQFDSRVHGLKPRE